MVFISIERLFCSCHAAQLREGTLGAGPGNLAWPGLLRKLDRLDPGYRS
jgi:hypothetical protein